jgi:hypothetical protein
MMAKLYTHHEWMMARMDFQLEKMEACPENMDTTDLEANQGKSRDSSRA